MLVPSKIVTAGYAEVTRDHLVRETTLRYLHRVPEREAARFGATTYPLATVFKKQSAGNGQSVRLGFAGSATVPQRALARPGPWILVPDRMRAALCDFRASGTPLGSIAPPALGVKTGADPILVGEPVERLGAVSRVRFGRDVMEIESKILRPVLRGRDFSTEDMETIRGTHEVA